MNWLPLGLPLAVAALGAAAFTLALMVGAQATSSAGGVWSRYEKWAGGELRALGGATMSVPAFFARHALVTRARTWVLGLRLHTRPLGGQRTNTAVCALRRAIAVSDDCVPLIHTRRGMGYVIEDPPQ